MEQLESNSIKKRDNTKLVPAEAEKKKVNKVVKGQVGIKKKSLSQKAGEALLSNEAGGIGSYILSDVLIPAIKDTLADMATSAINMAFYGDTRGTRSSRSKGSNIYRGEIRSYENCYVNGRGADRREHGRDRYDLDNITFSSRGDAEEVLDTMIELIDRYDMATVGDLYDLIGEQTRTRDFNYGWTQLGAARIRPYGRGYVLELPRVESLA